MIVALLSVGCHVLAGCFPLRCRIRYLVVLTVFSMVQGQPTVSLDVCGSHLLVCSTGHVHIAFLLRQPRSLFVSASGFQEPTSIVILMGHLPLFFLSLPQSSGAEFPVLFSSPQLLPAGPTKNQHSPFLSQTQHTLSSLCTVALPFSAHSSISRWKVSNAFFCSELASCRRLFIAYM